MSDPLVTDSPASLTPPALRRRRSSTRSLTTLAVDIGGTGVKASVLDPAGALLADQAREDTPVGEPPDATIDVVARLAQELPAFDRISAGFPGSVGAGRVFTAPNLKHRAWLGFDLAGALGQRFGKPARVANDVALQGLAVISRTGVELVITLGTGVGSALYLDGLLVPQFSLGGDDKGPYNDRLNRAALEEIGPERWNRRLGKALATLRDFIHYDRLYIGGGNAKKVTIDLDIRTTLISNEAGLRGGIALWRPSRRSPARRSPTNG